MTKPRILFATNNLGKVTEAQVFAAGADMQLATPKELGLKLDVDETGTTYEQNALLKAEAFQRELNDPSIIVIADDSGIEIPVLNNEPGIHSRRWKGYPMTDQEIIAYSNFTVKRVPSVMPSLLLCCVLLFRVSRQNTSKPLCSVISWSSQAAIW